MARRSTDVEPEGTQITISGKAGHWVRIGPFNSQEKASRALEITKSMGFNDAYKISG